MELAKDDGEDGDAVGLAEAARGCCKPPRQLLTKLKRPVKTEECAVVHPLRDTNREHRELVAFVKANKCLNEFGIRIKSEWKAGVRSVARDRSDKGRGGRRPCTALISDQLRPTCKDLLDIRALAIDEILSRQLTRGLDFWLP